MKLQSKLSHEVLRDWNCKKLQRDCLVYPVFVGSKTSDIPSLPGLKVWSIDDVVIHLNPLVEKGLKAVLLFEKPQKKGDLAALDKDALVPKALSILKTKFPDILLIADVCLCAYTLDGHCGIFENGKINAKKTCEILGQIAVLYAEHGAHCLAPSGMIDGHVQTIRSFLDNSGYEDKSIMSYSAKFNSCFYGPFRNATGCGLKQGSRKEYQVPISSFSLPMNAIKRDIEYADLVIVKPTALDLVFAAKQQYPQLPVAVYQVSGEYAMFKAAAQAGVFSLRDAVLESLNSSLRAGASILITYFVPEILEWI